MVELAFVKRVVFVLDTASVMQSGLSSLVSVKSACCIATTSDAQGAGSLCLAVVRFHNTTLGS